MAVDTWQKRASAAMLLGFGRPPGVANTKLDQAERTASVWSYSGIVLPSAKYTEIQTYPRVLGRIRSKVSAFGHVDTRPAAEGRIVARPSVRGDVETDLA